MTMIYALVLLGVLIFVHELGHFIFAKLLGVKVLKFSLGFGPKVIGKTHGETEYVISAFPLGGYVKMLGQEDMPTEAQEIPEADKHRAFNFQAVWKRFVIVFAGPLFNLVFAFIVYIFLYHTGVPVSYPDIGKLAQESPAAKAGFMTGDRVLKVNGIAIHDWEDIEDILSKNKDAELRFSVKRDNEILALQVRPEKKIVKDVFGAEHETFDIGVSPLLRPIVGETIKGMPAYETGLRKGDRILAVEGIPIRSWEDMTEIVHANPDKPLHFKVQRTDKILELNITPVKKTVNINIKDERVVGQIGIRYLKDDLSKSFGFVESVRLGFKKAWEMCVVTVVVFWKLIERAIPASSMGGPLMIVQMAGEQGAEGAFYFFSLMAAISINLGVLNLFPIPVLDGGHLLFFSIEAARKKPLSDEVIMYTQKVGLFLLLALIVFVTYNDVLRLVTGKMLP
jgi:regulator of sigma E protease